MKTMSQVSHVSDCPETLEEAQQIIRELTARKTATKEKMRDLLAEILEDYTIRSLYTTFDPEPKWVAKIRALLD
jgi:hypothetical protein